ncbi:MAG: hypothetical protein V7K41_11800 [Nostoc sp.]
MPNWSADLRRYGGFCKKDPTTKLGSDCGGLKPTELVKVIDAFAERLIGAASFRE